MIIKMKIIEVYNIILLNSLSYHYHNYQLVLSLDEYASLISNDINSHGSLFHNEPNNINTNNVNTNHTNHNIKRKKKKDDIYLSNDINHRLIDNTTTNQYNNNISPHI